MLKIKLVLLTIVLLCASCAGIETIADTVLPASEFVIENPGGFLENPDHQKVITEMAIEIIAGTKISAMDVLVRCAVPGCHQIKI